MNIRAVTECLEQVAPVHLQEDYDNAGLLIGNGKEECTGVLVTLDVTEETIGEAVRKKCNLVVAHHPVIFRGLKRLNGKNYVERVVLAAVKSDVAVYAIHTNLDNVLEGVNFKIAQKINLQHLRTLSPRDGLLRKLVTFCPTADAPGVRKALFEAGAGSIGKYSDCSFTAAGTGSFTAGAGTTPYVGQIGIGHEEPESRIEVIYPVNIENKVLQALQSAHPYEEIAYDLYPLVNRQTTVGSGLIGDLPAAVSESELLAMLKEAFGLSMIRHSPYLGKKISTIAVCGGAGSFLIGAAKTAGAGAFITADLKYHEFFDADQTILLADIGHFESEQFTVELLTDILRQKFPNFAVLKTETNTNPVHYFL